ncbi:MAG: 30S ribosome-binding factor RbfA [Bacteroidota bacterium]
MEKTRLKKVDRLIQKELSLIFQQNPLAEYRNILISVTVVRISPDLSVARVYLSIFPSDDSEEIVEKITEHTGKIKYELGKKVRNQLRKIPDLKFFVDDSLDYAGKIDDLLK